MTEKPVLSVTEISLSLKACVEQVFSDIRVRGEVSSVKRAPSGHVYFSLKDTDSVLSAVCWRGRDKATLSALEEGLEIICTGKLSTYPGRSNYQMIVERAEPAGAGALLKLLNDRREKLEKEGLFDASTKKPIPFLPAVIGVISSPTGAVIRDIMHRLNDRFPRPVLLWPVLVQGEGAADQITAAINGFNAIPQEGLQTPNGIIARPEVLIVARGGGSLEDLWCFNEENVVRAAAASAIPLISAVGHETDTTLIDFASDKRAPTPTAAAEYAVPVRLELMTRLNAQKMRLDEGTLRYLSDKQTQMIHLGRALPNLSDLVNTFIQRLDDRSERLQISINTYIKDKQNQFTNLKNLLKSYSYKGVLQRGFAVVSGIDKTILTSAATAQTHSLLTVTFADGSFVATPTTPFPSSENSSDTLKYSKNSTQKTLDAADISSSSSASLSCPAAPSIVLSHTTSLQTEEAPLSQRNKHKSSPTSRKTKTTQSELPQLDLFKKQ